VHTADASAPPACRCTVQMPVAALFRCDRNNAGSRSEERRASIEARDVRLLVAGCGVGSSKAQSGMPAHETAVAP